MNRNRTPLRRSALVGLGILAVGLAAAATSPDASRDTPDPAVAEGKKRAVSIIYTINNVGYVEPCG